MADHEASPSRDTGAIDRDRGPVINAVVGAAVTVVLAFLPFSPAVGGGVAGYLQGGDAADGLRVGALSGVLAILPVIAFFVLLGAVLGVVGTAVAIGSIVPPIPAGEEAGVVAAVVAVVGLLVILVAFGYVVGLSAIGGAVGAHLSDAPALDPTAE